MNKNYGVTCMFTNGAIYHRRITQSEVDKVTVLPKYKNLPAILGAVLTGLQGECVSALGKAGLSFLHGGKDWESWGMVFDRVLDTFKIAEYIVDEIVAREIS